ncbi:hypothetical protein Rsub_04877 [Raphidocelis subcapitata]|uniref:G domain-containing protein n=1 Tax=Raphidocelis subcapitata TaxID=307507 RepID=A0A2V0NU72_9CHLO|nr:hypothetical protein Rsub_04877 [Raphidocelis subcapitata]|eukprot:GBF91208.1 hypothetical protein Rsub_04877 [Raphidocelis subcapitata]
MAARTWYPGHMARARRQMQRVLRQVDLVLEVRDARLPFSSGNPDLGSLTVGKRRLVLLNKSDLADPAASEAALRQLRGGDAAGGGAGGGGGGTVPANPRGPQALLTCVHQPKSIKQLLAAALEACGAGAARAGVTLLMVAGAPNTGKSHIINALKQAAKSQGILPGEQAFNRRTVAGNLPGLTRQVQGFQVCASPEVYVLDTPGVLQQRIRSEKEALKLSLAGIVKASIVGDDATVAYLIGLLRSEDRHRRTLEAAAARLRDPTGGRGGGGSGADTGRGRSVQQQHQQQQQQPQADAGRAPQQRQLLRIAEALLHAAAEDLPAQEWHPGLEDPSSSSGGSGGGALLGADGQRRLALLLEALGVDPLGRDPSQRAAALAGVLRAFRSGGLGRWTLDHV